MKGRSRTPFLQPIRADMKLGAQELPAAAAGGSCVDELDELVAGIADALLGPLTCIVGYAETLGEEFAPRLAPPEQLLLDAVLRNSELLRQRFCALVDSVPCPAQRDRI